MNTTLAAEFREYSPDELSYLYKSNPDRFNELAAAALNQACIGKTQQQTIRLRQTQWLIDGQLRKAKTPLHRMQIMENIFYSRVYGEDGELKQLLYSCKDLLAAVGYNARTPLKPALSLLKNSGINEKQIRPPLFLKPVPPPRRPSN